MPIDDEYGIGYYESEWEDDTYEDDLEDSDEPDEPCDNSNDYGYFDSAARDSIMELLKREILKLKRDLTEDSNEDKLALYKKLNETVLSYGFDNSPKQKQETREEKLIRQYKESKNDFASEEKYNEYLINEIIKKEKLNDKLDNTESELKSVKYENKALKEKILEMDQKLKEFGVTSYSNLNTASRKVRIIND